MEMSFLAPKSKLPWQSIALVAFLVSGMCSSSYAFGGWLFGPPVKEFTGTVLDAETKQPIEGAYVLASYSIVRSGPAATTMWCVKTRGMTTGKDGTFRFPTADLRDGLPPQVSAIKLDYILAGGRIPRAWNNNSSSKEAYQGWDVHLKKQTPEKPQGGFNPQSHCEYAETQEDAAASVYFQKLELADEEKYWPLEKWPQYKQSRGFMQSRIQRLESRPSAAANGDKKR